MPTSTNYVFTFKPGFSLHFQQPRIEAVLILPFPFFLCRKVEAVTLNFGLLTVQTQEERGQKLGKGKPLAVQPSVKDTKHRPKSQPPPLQMLYASFPREFRMKQSQGIWTVKMALCFNPA